MRSSRRSDGDCYAAGCMEQSLAAPALAVGQAQALQPDQALDLGQAHALPAPMAPSEDQAAQLQHIAPQPSMHSADSPQLQLAEKKAAQASGLNPNLKYCRCAAAHGQGAMWAAGPCNFIGASHDSDSGPAAQSLMTSALWAWH